MSYLKKTFGEVLLDEESFDEVEYNARLGALMEMLRARGTEMSASVHRIFSGSISKGGSLLSPCMAVQKERQEDGERMILECHPRATGRGHPRSRFRWQ